jgi:hypothetical protein
MNPRFYRSDRKLNSPGQFQAQRLLPISRPLVFAFGEYEFFGHSYLAKPNLSFFAQAFLKLEAFSKLVMPGNVRTRLTAFLQDLSLSNT